MTAAINTKNNLDTEKIIMPTRLRSTIGLSNEEFIAPPLSNEFYADSYELRKAASTMTPVTIEWFQRNLVALLEKSISSSEGESTFSVLSIGSGEGDIDIEIINSLMIKLSPSKKNLRYVALEPNAIHRQRFQQRVDKAVFGDNVEVLIRGDYFSSNSLENEKQYDLILLTQVLYYFDDPYQAIRQALIQTRNNGRVVIIHQTETGIPQIQREQMFDVKGNQNGMLTAEAIKKLLDNQRHSYQFHAVDAYLDITECLDRSELGIKIMSFCMECDLRQLQNAKIIKILQAFWKLAKINEMGKASIHEPIGIFVLEAPADSMGGGKCVEDNDPVDDYWQLAQHFDWSNTLLAQFHRGQHSSLRILDVACGTGRWLQAVNHYLELHDVIHQISYDCLDPCASAIAQVSQKIIPPFSFGQQYISTLQEAELNDHSYDLLWSMHGFYMIPCEDLAFVLRKCLNLLNDTGVGFIALATSKSFYVDFYEKYLQFFQDGNGLRFTAAEDIVEALSVAGISYQVDTLAYEEAIKADDYASLEHYIKNEATINCFNKDHDMEHLSTSKSITLESLFTHPQMNDYLNSLLRNGVYYIPEEILLISFTNNETNFKA